MKKTYPELPRWVFEVDEVSANVFQVIGTTKSGHQVSATGSDLDELIEQCRNDARNIEAASPDPNDPMPDIGKAKGF